MKKLILLAVTMIAAVGIVMAQSPEAAKSKKECPKSECKAEGKEGCKDGNKECCKKAEGQKCDKKAEGQKCDKKADDKKAK